MHVPFVDLRAQTESIKAQVDVAMRAVIERGDFILGDEVHAFEEDFAAFCGVRFGIGVDSGTSAIELALRAVGVGVGDEVITQANTFIATAFAVSQTGADLRLVDVDPNTATMDPELLTTAISPRTKAILPVHLYGRPSSMAEILAIARAHGVAVVEDACQAHGAYYGDRRVGSLGDVAAFSFYPSKNLGAWGDGGAVVTDNEEIADAIRMLRNYGQRERYRHELVAFNRRLDSLQATLLRVKLASLDHWNDSRRRHAEKYAQALPSEWVELPADAAPGEHAWHLYVVRSEVRDALRAFLSEHDVQTGIHYPIPIHLQPAYAGLQLSEGTFPVTERLARTSVSLPMYPELGEHQLAYVGDCVRAFFTEDEARAQTRVRAPAGLLE